MKEPKSQRQKILIVDDEESIVTLLEFNIKQAGFQVDVAYDGLEAHRKITNNSYHLILLDLMLPKLNGFELCQKLRSQNIFTPILMLTARDEEEDKILGLELGADDYLTKPFSPKEVLARIRAILRRIEIEQRSDDAKIQIGDLHIYPKRFVAKIDDWQLSFTRKEFELLHFLAKNKGTILSREKLLKEVWDYDFVGDTRIVDVHISRLRDKIEVNSKKPRFIKTVRGLGYKMEDVSS